ncbi:hypothetical protein AgCh_017414 [Apium graveolens]
MGRRALVPDWIYTDGARNALSLAGTMLGFYPVRVLPSKNAIAPINPTFFPRFEDEREMCARTIFCTNIDKKVTQADVKLFFETVCGEVLRLKLLRDYHHLTRIAFVEFVMENSLKLGSDIMLNVNPDATLLNFAVNVEIYGVLNIVGSGHVEARMNSEDKVASCLATARNKSMNVNPKTDPSFRVKAVNLGGWLVTESRIKPSLFDGIVNRDFLAWRVTETTYQLRVFNKQFISVDKDANNIVLATTIVPGESHTFQIVRNSDNANRVKIKSSNGFFLQVNH